MEQRRDLNSLREDVRGNNMKVAKERKGTAMEEQW
jgi:hypothetical protein